MRPPVIPADLYLKSINGQVSGLHNISLLAYISPEFNLSDITVQHSGDIVFIASRKKRLSVTDMTTYLSEMTVDPGSRNYIRKGA